MNETLVLETVTPCAPQVQSAVQLQANDCCLWNWKTGRVCFMRGGVYIPLHPSSIGLDDSYGDEGNFTHAVRMYCIHRAPWNEGKRWHQREEDRFMSLRRNDGREVSLTLIEI